MKMVGVHSSLLIKIDNLQEPCTVGIEASSEKYCNDLHISAVLNLPKALFSFTFVNRTKCLVFNVLTNLYFLCTAFQWRNFSIFIGATGGDI